VDAPKIPEGDELCDLFRRAAGGDESTLPVVRECLQRPGALEAYGDMGRIAQQKLVKPGFPRWLGRFGMAFAPFPRKTQRFPRLPAEATKEPNG
jgi:hypothetical protein